MALLALAARRALELSYFTEWRLSNGQDDELMKITLLGCGGMGQAVKRLALDAGHALTTVDPQVAADYAELNADAVRGSDVAIDCSLGAHVPANVDFCVAAGLNLVVVATDWYERLPEIRRKVESGGIGFLWSSNFSIGVNLFFKLVERAAQLANRFEEYDVWAHELHHANKIDAPSGTAREVGRLLLENIDRKRAIVDDKLARRRAADEIHISSARGGAVNFAHWVGFESDADSLVIKHNARNRDGFARGAALAAEWLVGKTGYFEMGDFLKGLSGE